MMKLHVSVRIFFYVLSFKVTEWEKGGVCAGNSNNKKKRATLIEAQLGTNGIVVCLLCKQTRMKLRSEGRNPIPPAAKHRILG